MALRGEAELLWAGRMALGSSRTCTMEEPPSVLMVRIMSDPNGSRELRRRKVRGESEESGQGLMKRRMPGRKPPTTTNVASSE